MEKSNRGIKEQLVKLLVSAEISQHILSSLLTEGMDDCLLTMYILHIASQNSEVEVKQENASAGENPVNYSDPLGLSKESPENDKAFLDEKLLLGVGAGEVLKTFGLVAAAKLLSVASIPLLLFTGDQIDYPDGNDENFTVRLQAQGSGLEKSVTISQDQPVRANQALEGLDKLKSQLTNSELRERDQAIEKAKQFILNAASAGGTTPTSRTFTNRGTPGRKARIDVEVLRGTVNLIP